jgi:hypothetical protein
VGNDSVKLGAAIGVTAGAMILFVAVLMFARGRHMHEEEDQKQEWKNIEDGNNLLPTPRTLDDHFEYFSPTSSSPVNLSSSSSEGDFDDKDNGESQVLGAGPSPWRVTKDIQELKSGSVFAPRDDTASLLSEKDSKKGPIRGKKILMSAPWGRSSRQKKKSKKKDDRYYQSCLEPPSPMTPIKEQHDERSGSSSSDRDTSSEIQSINSDSLLSAQGKWESRSEAESPKTDLDDRSHAINAISPVVRLLETPAVALSWREIALKQTSEEVQTPGEALQLNLEGEVIRVDLRKNAGSPWDETLADDGAGCQ